MTVRGLLIALVGAALAASLGCASATSRPPETIEEWMALEQVHP